MDNINTIKEIRDGKLLTEFSEEEITPIMVLAALSVRDAWDEVPVRLRNRRFSKTAVGQNFRHLEHIKPENVIHCCSIYANWAGRVTRNDIADYRRILNAQEDGFIINCLRQNSLVRKFIDEDRITLTKPRGRGVNGASDIGPKPEHFYVDTTEFDAYDFAGAELGDNDELNPESYLARPVARQTKKDLDELLSLPDRFPSDFIYRLQQPYQNAHFYQTHNEPEKAKIWEAKKIPWLNKQVCLEIAQMHPEASIKTPGYLTGEGIAEFWNWTKEADFTKKQRTEYYLGFPANLLTKDMLNDIEIDWQVIRHTPEFFITTDPESGKRVFTSIARKYLNKHPNDVFRLPEQFQTITKVIADGTSLTAGNIARIHNPELRRLIACAVGVTLPGEEETKEPEKEHEIA